MSPIYCPGPLEKMDSLALIFARDKRDILSRDKMRVDNEAQTLGVRVAVGLLSF